MPNETYLRIMEILDEQRMKEVECAMRSKELMKRSFLHPVRYIQSKICYEMFMNHANGIRWAMGSVRREFEP